MRLILSEIEIKELEWYVRDHFFKQYDQGKQQFTKGTLAKEMIDLYLRYRGSDLDKLSSMMNSVIEGLVSRLVIKQLNDNSIQLTSRLTRLQCSRCFYISYLSSNESRKCLRCSATELHDFPRKKKE